MTRFGRRATATPASDTTALLTDHYELTMVEAALRSGTANRRATFEVFARRLPEGRRYGVVAGTGRLLDAIERFRFDDAAIAVLKDMLDKQTLDWLTSYRFSGNVWGYGEGECYFPGSPILIVESTFAEAVVLETLALSILNHDSAIASAASRMIAAAGGRPCIEMGSRRTHEVAAVAAARAAYIAGFATTSNLEARRRYAIPTAGTSAHAFILLHDSESEAFAAQIASLGKGTTLLVDTYNVRDGVRHAVEAAGPELGAIRLDSGDLVELAHEARVQLDELGATRTRIVVTSDLDEFQIAAMAAAPVDTYGVGTSLVTGSGAPTAGLVYKLVARSASTEPDAPPLPVMKTSIGKATRGGRKWAARCRDDAGVATRELIGIVTERESVPAARAYSTAGERGLLVPLIIDGEIVGREPLDTGRTRHQASFAELPVTAHQLSRGDPTIPTVYLEERS